MTPSDPLDARLAEIDPAKDVAVDRARTEALVEHLRATIATNAPPATKAPVRARHGHQLVRSVPILIGVLVVVVVAGLALGELRQAPRQPTPTSPALTASGRRALLDMLAVLRRPQTALDRRVFAQSGLARIGVPAFGVIDPASARVAAVTPWGSRVLVALTKPTNQADSRAATGGVGARNTGGSHALGQARLVLFADHGGGGAGTPASIRAGQEMMTEGWGASYAGGSTGVRAYVVVPDGIARVTFVLPQTDAARSHGPRYARPLRITVAVHGNIAAFEAHRSCCQGLVPMIWYAADGHVIKRIGDVSATEKMRAAARPAPAPATAASRAAEHDPATPSPVTVTPRTGRPTTTFRLSWRLLLTGADYRFDPVGPEGSGCYGANAIPGGLGGGTTDVRGQIYGESLGPLPSHPWCPGAYRVSVRVLDLGPGRPALSPAPKPFGSTTFTVRR